MATEPFLHGHATRFLIRTQAALALVLLLLLGSLDFFFPTTYSLQAGVHGVSAITAVILGTFMTHRAYPLIRGVQIDLHTLRYWAAGATAANLLGAISGNWIYQRYRGQDGPRDWILDKVPDFHNVLMEFKEFVSLFPFPLMLAVLFILFYYGADIQRHTALKQLAGVAILLAWAFLMFGFVAGLTLAKLHFV